MMSVGRPLRYMLMLISVTTLYLVVMLDRWSEQARGCQPNRSAWPQIHNTSPHTDNVQPCKCQTNNFSKRFLARTANVAKQETVHIRQKRHINYLGARDAKQEFVTFRRLSQTESQNLELRLRDLQKLLVKLEGSRHIDQLGVNGEEIKSAQVTVGDVIALMNGTSPRQHLSSLRRDYGSMSLSSTESENKSTTLDVCPEVYKGSTHGYPFFYKGFETMLCTNAKPLKDVISAIFNFVNYPIKYRSAIMEIVSSFSAEHPGVPVFVAVSDSMFSDDVHSMPAQVDIVSHSTRQAVMWNRLIAQVKTPYTFIAKGLLAFNQDSRLERLVSAISTLKVPIAGGAIKTADGYWNMGCHQSVYKNYTLIYKAGYYHSLHECVLCSHITGPFVARTSFLQNHRFDESLDARVLFEDYLFNLSQNHTGMVVCPDSMFYVQTDDKERYQKSVWLPFARKWRINQIGFGHSDLINFTCEMLRIDCSFITGLAVPPCCLQLLAEQIKFLMTTCEKHGIICELQEGTLLGAVKFNKVLPWERDGDITFLSSNFSALKNLSHTFAVGGYRLSPQDDTRCCVDGRTAGGTFVLTAVGSPSWHVELYGQHRMDTEIALENGDPPTKIFYHGMWVNVPRNPGLHVRNRYGPEIYKHAQHWISLRRKSGWEPYTPSGFSKCPIPRNNNCLDQYSADGNIQFGLPSP